jgi:hypothetical protein
MFRLQEERTEQDGAEQDWLSSGAGSLRGGFVCLPDRRHAYQTLPFNFACALRTDNVHR